MSELPRNDHLPADLVRGLTQARLSRRGALQLGGASALAMVLTACGVSSGTKAQPTGTAAVDAAKKFWQSQHKAGTLDFANWPLYMDVGGTKDDHPSLDLFAKQTGIKVNYSIPIELMASFFGKIQPVLAQGQSIGYDLIVITNGIYLDKMLQLGYLVPLDQTAMTNFRANAAPLYKSPSYDKGNIYTMAWQSGITGIGYDPKLTGRDLTSWSDLLDPAFQGKIGMFADTEDLPNSALLAVGVDPENSTPDDWKKAAAWLTKQRDSGVVRKYYEQDYIGPLSKGDLSASMAWSGDIFQANASGAHLKFVVPKEGAAIWTDNMCIPQHAAHPRDAMIYMDWVYQPKPAAMLAEYINYITPVPGAAQVIKSDAAAAKGGNRSYLEQVATSPLVFPSQADYSRLHRYRVLTTAEEKVWNSLFEPIFQS